ncbi:MAG: alkaline phosphatase D family protein [Hymenobacteraceae bacterium]|nr:alkaline phosphatase D family protein [Hymenobacteraceae bacterium]
MTHFTLPLPLVGTWRRYALVVIFVVGTLAATPGYAQQKPLAKRASTEKSKPPAKAKAKPKATPKAPVAAADKTQTRDYPPAERHPAPPDLLRSGPMVTYSTMREVGLWVQLSRVGGAQIEYWEKGQPQRRWRTAVVLTTGPDHLAELIADSVRPGRKYSYRLWAADADHDRLRVVVRPYPLEFQSQMLWQWRTDPPDFRVALGSCAYVNDSLYDRPGNDYGGDYGIFTAISSSKPDLMVWLGDNTYLREADWDSPTGIRYRYAHTRALPALQPLLGSVHHYATWDDHDYGPSYADRTHALRETARETFRRYWPSLASGQGGSGVATTFQWSDVQFFLLDDRWHRTPKRDDMAHGQFLGPDQLRWLTEGLAMSHATFKIICVAGQVLNPAKVYENYANYETERAELLRRLADLRVPGVVFLTGDRNYAELSRLDRPGLYPLYDLTTSPLTAGPARGGQHEKNSLRDSATFRAERNFALLDVAGPEKARTLTLTLCGVDGQPFWKRELRAADLRPGATPAAPPPAPVASQLVRDTSQAASVPPTDSAAAAPPHTRKRRTRARHHGPNAAVRVNSPLPFAPPRPVVVAGNTRRPTLPAASQHQVLAPLRPVARPAAGAGPVAMTAQSQPAQAARRVIAAARRPVTRRPVVEPLQPIAAPVRVERDDTPGFIARLPLR